MADVEWLGGGGGRRGVAGRDALVVGRHPAVRSGCPRAELLDRIGAATVYLHWTAWDGLPLSILEAMALDVVVVASDIPPNREILGPDAVCASEEEAVALLRASSPSRPTPRSCARLSAPGAGEFSAENMVKGWHEVYDRLLAPDPEPAGVVA